MTKKEGNYTSVNGLNMYYEIHGEGKPLVLLHGALSEIKTSFGNLIPRLAESRQIIAIEQQAHGHTEDVDRPLTIDQMTKDTVALLKHMGIEKTDVFGYSMGAGIALQMAIMHKDLIQKLILASVTYNNEGFQPGLLEGMENLKPENLDESPWQKEYLRIAPDPENWPLLVYKVKEMNLNTPDWPAEKIQSIKAQSMIIIGDSDIVLPEHAVEMFKLMGGGNDDLSSSQLLILPGTTHITVLDSEDCILPMIEEFLSTTK